MQNKILPYIIFVICLLQTSCKSRKDMVYIQDTSNQDEITIESSNLNSYLLKSDDNLFVDIQTLDPQVNALFNPTKSSGAAGGTSQNFGDITSQTLNGFLIDIRGDITLPIIGKVKVEGLTIDEAQSTIQEKTHEYLKDATVKVKLLNFKYTVMGEVSNPGVYYNYNNTFTILDAISTAKGETDYSEVKKVSVVRTRNSKSKIYQLDLTKKDFLSSEVYFIQPNDVIYIEPDKSKALKINMPVYTLVLSSISTIVLMLNFIRYN